MGEGRGVANVSATKTKITRPSNSNFLGFTFHKNRDEWQCKPGDDVKQNFTKR